MRRIDCLRITINYLNLKKVKDETKPPKYIPRDTLPSSRVCTYCKQEKPISAFEKMKTGTYRYVCNACKYRYYTLPAYYRRKARDWGLT